MGEAHSMGVDVVSILLLLHSIMEKVGLIENTLGMAPSCVLLPCVLQWHWEPP